MQDHAWGIEVSPYLFLAAELIPSAELQVIPEARRIRKAMGAVYLQNVLPRTDDHLRRLKMLENRSTSRSAESS